jgi:hypothetical protein
MVSFQGISGCWRRGYNGVRQLNLLIMNDGDIECLKALGLASSTLNRLTGITPRRVCEFDAGISQKLENVGYIRNRTQEEVAGHTLTLFKDHPQLWDDGLE